MQLWVHWATALFLWIATGSASSNNDLDVSTDPSSFDPDSIIRRDVAVIGGGSSGIYTALRLRDYNKTVVVVEKKTIIGGHAETYVDPYTGYTIDIGVVIFARLKVVADYFARFRVPLGNFSISGGPQPEYVDFSTGKSVYVSSPSNAALATALNTYATQLLKYPGLRDGFNLTYPVEPDLLLPFGDFVVKYNLQALVPTVFIVNQGYAPILNISTLYLFKYLNLDQVTSFGQGYWTTAKQNIQELYQKAAVSLGRNLYTSSSVIAINRSDKGSVRVLVNTPTGRKLIIAKKLVSTPPPTIDSLGGYDLSEDETCLFSQFFANAYYTGVLNHTGFDKRFRAAGPGQPYNIPELPGPYIFFPNQGLTQVYYGSPEVLSADYVKADILAIIKRVQKVRGLPITTPEWLTFSAHAPFNLQVSNEAIQAGFYKKLFALQGQRNTFYNGAAWQTQDSSAIWQFTEDYILPLILASLQY